MPSSHSDIQKLADEALQAALDDTEAGRLDAAEALFRGVLQLQPGRAEAHFGLGYLARRAGHAQDAIPHFTAALQAAPGEAAYWLAYLEALMAARQFVTARELLALGRDQGLEGPEIDAIEAQLAAGGEPAQQEIDAASALYSLGRKDEAGELARSLAERFPQHPFGWQLLGGVLYGKRAYPEALEAMRTAAAHAPDDARTLCNLGLMLKRAGQLDEARAVLERAIALDPGSARAHNYLAATLQELGLPAQALASAEAALAIEPGYVKAMSSLAVILDNLGRTGEAVAAYRRVLALDPDQPDAHGNLLFCMSHMESVTLDELFAEHLRFGQRLEARFAGARKPHPARPAQGPLRVGFVSGDLRQHAIATFIEPVFRELSGRPSLELQVYYNHPLADETTRRLRGTIGHWRDVATLDDDALDAQIRADRIDILVDLSSHTAYNRLPVFARKPAPVQVSWLGYPGTTGLTTMDYYLCDPYLVPPGRYDHLFTEKLAHLPAVAFQPGAEAPEVAPLPALANGHPTFGSFNRLSKISRKVIAAWGRLLRALPDAQLLIAGMPADGAGRSQLEAWLRDEAIDPARVAFHGRVGTRDYLALHARVDICLDTFPYTGGTTTMYALYMGVPTLTIAGDSIAGRQSACLLSHHNLQRFIARDVDDFVQKGIDASRDLAALARIRAALRDGSPLWTEAGVARVADGVEQAFLQMWRRWNQGLPPAAFTALPG
jgi:predicted O-linked N-acetylglucosamine transferase (SPINDLY family)